MDSKICYIFGAGEQSSCDIRLSGSDLVIAADGGFDYLKKLGLRADVVLGDFDSLSDSQNLPEDFIRYPQEKDDTDMMIAIKEGLARGYRTFRIYGGLGGRLDHTIANLQSLTFLAENQAVGTLYSDYYQITVIKDGTLSFAKDMPENVPGNLCSVFSLSDISVGVSIQGLKYELDRVTLTNGFPLGVSNEFLGKKSFIHVEKGTLAVYWNCQ